MIYVDVIGGVIGGHWWAAVCQGSPEKWFTARTQLPHGSVCHLSFLPITVLHLCTAAYASLRAYGSHCGGSLWWEQAARAYVQSGEYLHIAHRCTLRTGEYSHGDRMEALPVPVVLRLNRGGRKSRRAICNCSRCAAALQASRLIICRAAGVLRLALKDEGAGFTGKRELSNWIWKVPRGFSSADGYNQILSMLVGNR